MFFTKNTLSLDDTVGAIAHMARVSIEYYGDLNRFPTINERTRIMNNYLRNDKGSCSFWHRTKLTQAGIQLAISVMENKDSRDLAIKSYLPFSPDAEQERMDITLKSYASAIAKARDL